MLNIIYKYGFYILKNVEYKTNDLNYYINNKQWGLGIGDWGLGIGDWAQSPIPNPQSPNYLFHL